MVDPVFSSQQYLMAKKLLDATALRHEALASNIANLETPGYKRVDLAPDFDTQFREAVRKTDPKALAALKPALVQDKTAAAVRPDGNNVSMDKEMMEVNRNEANYEFLSQYLSTSLQRIQAATKS